MQTKVVSRWELFLPLDWDVEVGNLVEDELYERLVLVLPEELDERLRRESLAELDGGEAVLSEAVVKVIPDCTNSGRLALPTSIFYVPVRVLTVLSVDGELLGDLGQVRSADEADNSLGADLLQESEHLRSSLLQTPTPRSHRHQHQHTKCHFIQMSSTYAASEGEGAVDICWQRSSASASTNTLTPHLLNRPSLAQTDRTGRGCRPGGGQRTRA